MIIQNVTTGLIQISDLPGAQQGASFSLGAGLTAIIFDEDAEKSAQLQSFLDGGQIVKVGDAEPNPDIPRPTGGGLITIRGLIVFSDEDQGGDARTAAFDSGLVTINNVTRFVGTSVTLSNATLAFAPASAGMVSVGIVQINPDNYLVNPNRPGSIKLGDEVPVGGTPEYPVADAGCIMVARIFTAANPITENTANLFNSDIDNLVTGRA